MRKHIAFILLFSKGIYFSSSSTYADCLEIYKETLRSKKFWENKKKYQDVITILEFEKTLKKNKDGQFNLEGILLPESLKIFEEYTGKKASELLSIISFANNIKDLCPSDRARPINMNELLDYFKMASPFLLNVQEQYRSNLNSHVKELSDYKDSLARYKDDDFSMLSIKDLAVKSKKASALTFSSLRPSLLSKYKNDRKIESNKFLDTLMDHYLHQIEGNANLVENIMLLKNENMKRFQDIVQAFKEKVHHDVENLRFLESDFYEQHILKMVEMNDVASLLHLNQGVFERRSKYILEREELKSLLVFLYENTDGFNMVSKRYLEDMLSVIEEGDSEIQNLHDNYLYTMSEKLLGIYKDLVDSRNKRKLEISGLSDFFDINSSGKIKDLIAAIVEPRNHHFEELLKKLKHANNDINDVEIDMVKSFFERSDTVAWMKKHKISYHKKLEMLNVEGLNQLEKFEKLLEGKLYNTKNSEYLYWQETIRRSPFLEEFCQEYFKDQTIKVHMILDKDHIKKYKLKSNEDLLEDKIVDVNVTSIGRMFDKVNFADPKQPGFISKRYCYEDGNTYSKERLKDYLQLIIEVGSTSENGDIYFQKFKKKLKMITYLLSGDVDHFTRNTILVDLALSGTHCSSRRMKALIDAESTLIQDSSCVETFPVQLSRSLKNFRKNLLDHFNTSGLAEHGHGQMYWLHLLGKSLEIPEAVQFPEFKYQTRKYLGDNWNLSKEKALEIFYQTLYTSESVIKHVMSAINNPEEIKDYKVQFPAMLAWAEDNGISRDKLFNDDYKVTREGVILLLEKLGHHLTYVPVSTVDQDRFEVRLCLPYLINTQLQ
jgi:hypothetical protein